MEYLQDQEVITNLPNAHYYRNVIVKPDNIGRTLHNITNSGVFLFGQYRDNQSN